MMTENDKPARRSHWQSVAHKRYGRMRFLGGDGSWVCMSQCQPVWSYRLEYDWMDAMMQQRRNCGDGCQGESMHKIWHLLESRQ
jgi:hypothetical protein